VEAHVCVRRVSGDGSTVIQDRGRALILVVDGLGHGPDAAKAAVVALATVRAPART